VTTRLSRVLTECIALETAVIDKLEVRVPAETRFTTRFEELRSQWQDFGRPSRYYLRTMDLRPLGLSSILHMRARQTRDHKLELIDTAELGYSGIVSEIAAIFAGDVGPLEVMRIDLAADIEGVPVHAFIGHVRGKWKRSSAEIGHYSKMGKLGVETFYLGKRPNVYRIYNKIEELRAQYAKLREGDGPAPSFQDLFGYPENGMILTRVERQMGGGRIPDSIGTVEKLLRLGDFDPFDRLVIETGSAVASAPEGCTASHHLQGIGLRTLVEREGLQDARRIVNKLSDGNASRIFKNFLNYLPESQFNISEQNVFESYRESVRKQLAA